MFLKNYTSEVPVSQTIYRIEQVLIKCGVSGITKEYGTTGDVSAVCFQIKVDPNLPGVSVRLPVNKERALDALWLNYADGEKLTPDGNLLQWCSKKKKKRADFIQQAERTAWKIVQDWVEVQMSMIQMKQADFIEVFLPYVWNGHTTVYGRIKESGFRALLPEKGEQ
jgi:hypothetical protein